MLGRSSEAKALQGQVEHLRAENEQLRRKLMLLSGGNPSQSGAGFGTTSFFSVGRSAQPQVTIAGLSVSYLIVDSDLRVLRMNTRMADFLGVRKDVAADNPPIAGLDQLAWAPGVFQTLLSEARANQAEAIFEAERPGEGGARISHYQFKAVWSDGQGTLTVEDVTRLRTTRQFFERLVSPRIVERLLDTTDDPFLSHKRGMSVLFADLRSFTTFCEAVGAPVVQTVFNEFFDICMQAIEENDATLDKFVGDQVMALCGAPLPTDGHAYNAVKVAVDLQQAIQRTRRRWIEQGLLPQALIQAHPEILTLGVGINSGEMLLGMFGSQKANQYTVLGHHVNLAARLCSFAAGEEVLASLATVQEVSRYAKENPARIAIPIKFRTKAQIEVKGIAEPVTVATLAYEQA